MFFRRARFSLAVAGVADLSGRSFSEFSRSEPEVTTLEAGEPDVCQGGVPPLHRSLTFRAIDIASFKIVREPDIRMAPFLRAAARSTPASGARKESSVLAPFTLGG
jgi:hypothetical protein